MNEHRLAPLQLLTLQPQLPPRLPTPQGLVPALSSQANKGRSMLAAALQPRVDEALVSGNASSLGPLNQLVIDLAGVRETEALIRVWDAMGGSKGAEEAKSASLA